MPLVTSGRASDPMLAPELKSSQRHPQSPKAFTKLSWNSLAEFFCHASCHSRVVLAFLYDLQWKYANHQLLNGLHFLTTHFVLGNWELWTYALFASRKPPRAHLCSNFPVLKRSTEDTDFGFTTERSSVLISTCTR